MASVFIDLFWLDDFVSNVQITSNSSLNPVFPPTFFSKTLIRSAIADARKLVLWNG